MVVLHLFRLVYRMACCRKRWLVQAQAVALKKEVDRLSEAEVAQAIEGKEMHCYMCGVFTWCKKTLGKPAKAKKAKKPQKEERIKSTASQAARRGASSRPLLRSGLKTLRQRWEKKHFPLSTTTRISR